MNVGTGIRRWPGSAPGRSRVVAHGGPVWTVANASDATAPLAEQVAQSLRMLEQHLLAAGFARTHRLSLQVLLTDMAYRGEFGLIAVAASADTRQVGVLPPQGT